PMIKSSRSLERLLRPRSIAVFGGKEAAAAIEQCRKMGYAGEIWPVHPIREEIAGLSAYPSAAALPSSPDASFIGVNRHASIGIVRELAKIGAGGAVCYASGFGEADAPELEQELVAAAGDMPLLGPNCYG